MRVAHTWIAGILGAAALACGGGERAHRAAAVGHDTTTGPAAPPHVDSAPTASRKTPGARPRPTPVYHVPTPATLRALYVNRNVTRTDALWALLKLAGQVRANALVFDVKDDEGHVLYPSTVGLAHLMGADTVTPLPVRRLHALMDSLRRRNIYAIARIVVARDPVLAAHHPEWGLVHRADDAERNAWLDPRNRQIWAYAADLASEAAARGFSEVLFDNVRFPDSRSEPERLEVTPVDGRSRSQVIRDQLDFLRARVRELDVPMSIAVSARAALDSSDLGTGQRWEMVADHADAIVVSIPAPTAQPGIRIAGAGAEPAEQVRHVLLAARARSGTLWKAARIVPWYHVPADSSADGDALLRAELQAGRAAGVASWMVWSHDARYTREMFRADSVRSATSPAAGSRRR